MMSNYLHPGMILIGLAVFAPLLKGRVRNLYLLLLPLISLCLVWSLPSGSLISIQYLNYELQPLNIDNLSKLFSTVFLIAAFATTLFGLFQTKTTELITGYIYAGSAVSAVLTNDLISLFIFWELMAISSTLIVWQGNSKQSYKAGMRYLLMHLLGGVVLLFGIVMQIQYSNSLSYSNIQFNHVSSYFIIIGFLINAAAPPFSAWLADAYPESSSTGMVFLSAFTTKTAVFVLLKGFAGTEILIYIGLYMIFYGIIYALLENNMRRILAYSIVNQVGFMVCGIGIGTEMALNGAAAHAFSHIIYKALLLMSAGAVLYQTGKHKCTELGGLIHTMPATAIFGIIGALSISAFPLTSGFISKSLVTQASSDQMMFTVWLLLQAASAGVFLHAGIKFPWFVFFQKDSGLRPKEAPLNMLIAMGLLSAFCIVIGIAPGLLYQLLPYAVEYVPYTADHVLAQLQLLLFSGLAFFVMLPWMKRTLTISLDLDWFYRKLIKILLAVFYWVLAQFQALTGLFLLQISRAMQTAKSSKLDQSVYDLRYSLTIVLFFLVLFLIVSFLR